MNKNTGHFFDREQEKRELMSILTSRPDLIYFVYGPINSGKTTLLVAVAKSLPSEIVPFYINLRGRDVSSTGEFLNVLFDVDEDEPAKTERAFIRDVVSAGLKMLERFSGVPIPRETFNRLFKDKDKGKDVFKYLEEFFSEMVGKDLNPVFVVDELQMLKEIANASGSPLLDKLFNFMVRMTKETHLCHCLAATSDSLFVEQIQGNARLEGRSQYFIVDDVNMEVSFDMYEKFGFQDKELIWDYIGGKIGDMVVLRAWVNRGYGLKESLERMLRDEGNRLRMVASRIPDAQPQGQAGTIGFLNRFKEADTVPFVPNEMGKEGYLWIDQNVLFLDPPAGILRPQGRLVQKAIEALE